MESMTHVPFRTISVLILAFTSITVFAVESKMVANAPVPTPGFGGT